MKHRIVSICILLAMALVVLILRKDNLFLSRVLILSITGIYLVVTLYGVFKIRSNYFIRSVNEGSQDGIVLTFDDGPHPDRTPEILEILRKENVKATFFVIGKNAEKYPGLLKQISDEGHIVGNHSYSHSYSIGTFRSKTLREDLKKCSAVIENTIGKAPKFFRPPFGVTNPRYNYALAGTGMTSVGWSGRSFDTIKRSKEEVLERVKNFVKPGVIFLFHDTMRVTVEALPEFIGHCKEMGIKIVSLDQSIEKNNDEKV